MQASKTSKQRWKDQVRTAAVTAWPDGEPPLDYEVQIHVTYYHDSAPLDVDNMLKLILDALNGVVYVDDKQLTDTHGHLRDLNGHYRVRVLPQPRPAASVRVIPSSMFGSNYQRLRGSCHE